MGLFAGPHERPLRFHGLAAARLPQAKVDLRPDGDGIRSMRQAGKRRHVGPHAAAVAYGQGMPGQRDAQFGLPASVVGEFGGRDEADGGRVEQAKQFGGPLRIRMAFAAKRLPRCRHVGAALRMGAG